MSIYPTKRDWWIMTVIWGAAIFCIYTTFTVHNEPAACWMKVFATCFFALMSMLSMALALLPYYTTYTITSMNLLIRVGPISSKIAIDQIIEVYPTKNPLSAPAWSLDRLGIRLRSARLGALISPVRQKEFLEELAGYAPHLQLKEDRLVLIES